MPDRLTGWTLYLRLAHEARPYRRQVASLLVLSVASSALVLLTPVPLKIAVDNVVDQRPLPGVLDAVLPNGVTASQNGILLVAAVLFVVIALLRQLQQFGSLVLTTWTGERMLLTFRSRLFRHAEQLPLTHHDTKGTADSTYRIQYDATSVQNVVSAVIPFVTAVATVTGMIYVTARIDLQLALISLAVVPVLLFTMRLYRKRLRRQWHDAKRLDSSAMSVVQESLEALRVVKAFGWEDLARDRFTARSGRSLRAKVSLAFAEGRFGIIVGGTIGLGMAAVLFVGTRRVLSNDITLGELVLIMGYLQQLYDPLKTASKKMAALQSSLASAERAYALMDEPPDFVDAPDALPLARARGDVAFDNVSFAYEPANPVLQSVSFHAPAGTRVGIAGTTGAGKTTLVNLLTRFYDPVEGRILLDGQELHRYKLTDLRRQFAIVLQEPVLFSTSIAENIAYARPGASREDIEAAARAASAHEFICGLPEGYDTPVGERGLRLSGGERQRISLARAFLKDAPILILDEPTSSVDVRTEGEILTAMARLMRGRTTFMIAHRLGTLAICDLRLELEHGQLVRAAVGGAASGIGAKDATQATRRGPTKAHFPHRRRVTPDDPAVRAWEAVRAPGSTLERVDLLRSKAKSAVYRLSVRDRHGATSLIAKRGLLAETSRERLIYDEVLPRVPVPSLRFFGFVQDEDRRQAWLFLEDGGDDLYRLGSDPALSARWLGSLHGAAAELGLEKVLPDRGPRHYLEHLTAARDGLLGSLDNPNLAPADRGALREIVTTCERIACGWDAVEALCRDLPRTLVHGDLVERNLRLRTTEGQTAILAFDWEYSGVGVPSADVVQLTADAGPEDLNRYRRAFGAQAADLADDAVGALTLTGEGFRLIASLAWAIPHLRHTWPEKGMERIRCYQRPLEAWGESLVAAAPRPTR